MITSTHILVPAELKNFSGEVTRVHTGQKGKFLPIYRIKFEDVTSLSLEDTSRDLVGNEFIRDKIRKLNLEISVNFLTEELVESINQLSDHCAVNLTINPPLKEQEILPFWLTKLRTRNLTGLTVNYKLERCCEVIDLGGIVKRHNFLKNLKLNINCIEKSDDWVQILWEFQEIISRFAQLLDIDIKIMTYGAKMRDSILRIFEGLTKNSIDRRIRIDIKGDVLLDRYTYLSSKFRS